MNEHDSCVTLKLRHTNMNLGNLPPMYTERGVHSTNSRILFTSTMEASNQSSVRIFFRFSLPLFLQFASFKLGSTSKSNELFLLFFLSGRLHKYSRRSSDSIFGVFLYEIDIEIVMKLSSL